MFGGKYMEINVKKLEKCHVEATVDVDKEMWKGAQDKATKKALANVTVKGFRKGCAPEAMARKYVNQGEVLDTAINSLLNDLYVAVLKEKEITPFIQPKVDVTKVTLDELTVVFKIVTAPEIEMGAYKDLEIGKVEAKVEDKDLEEAINKDLKNNATLVVKEGKSEKGDTIVFDFVGKVDGVAFDGGSATNYELELGSNSFIPGFEDQLVGYASGDHVDVNVTFPENYTPELKGKAAVFACDIHEVKQKKLPVLDDDYVAEQNIENVKTVDEYKAKKKEELLKQAENNAKNAYIGKVLENIRNNSKVEIADEVIEEQMESRKQEITNRMKQNGLDMDSYLQIIGQSKEQFDEQLKKDVEMNIANFVILELVAKNENLVVTDEEFEFELSKIAETYKMSIDDVKKNLGPQGMGQFKNNMQMSRSEDFLFNNNK